MFEAKINLSGYVASVASQQEPCVVITRNGKPDAKSFRL
ncbi:MAG: type II toxin-antitoxin system Phd/YefM family antitoxin [Clostridia bacterium]|nr:type II toxin-antitoxin system Phd/YefM family antitoxin [Clostridia bacterium]